MVPLLLEMRSAVRPGLPAMVALRVMPRVALPPPMAVRAPAPMEPVVLARADLVVRRPEIPLAARRLVELQPLE